MELSGLKNENSKGARDNNLKSGTRPTGPVTPPLYYGEYGLYLWQSSRLLWEIKVHNGNLPG